MLESQRLRATEVSGLNDAAEREGGLEFAASWLQRQAAGGLIDGLGQLVSNLRDAAADVFVLSASIDGDDANQWRSYGAGGYGYCIELDTAVPLVPVSSEGPLSVEWASHLVAPWARVAYSVSEHDAYMRAFVVWAREVLDRLGGSESPQVSSDAGLQAAEFLGQVLGLLYAAFVGVSLGRLPPLLKGPGFAGEREARVVARVEPGGGVGIELRACDYGIVRYVELTSRCVQDGSRDEPSAAPPGAGVRLPIRSIAFGPRLDFESGRPALTALLARSGYAPGEVELRRSGVTLR